MGEAENLLAQMEGGAHETVETCRICASGKEDGEVSPLIYPCSCRAPVHVSCLQRWVESRPTPAVSSDPTAVPRDSPELFTCEVCKERYRAVRQDTIVWDRQHACSSASWRHGCEALAHLVTTGVMAWVMVVVLPASVRRDENDAARQRGPRGEEGEEGEESTLMVWLVYALWVVTIMASFFTLRRLWMRWRNASVATVLQPLASASSPLPPTTASSSSPSSPRATGACDDDHHHDGGAEDGDDPLTGVERAERETFAMLAAEASPAAARLSPSPTDGAVAAAVARGSGDGASTPGAAQVELAVG